ncbi:hypothetical protein IAI10_06370 [Clostridium sp. 19966]|uniref:hypothetical protein n=1 Tax=Clostridium sp. 19966 TaxID=2768166 RepID=UPI0028DFCBB9|nr:hypothetical protein [Clostridium sp. 19966]MDT8716275.1 hypothetical protein [Clostridium sp. 19966]
MGLINFFKKTYEKGGESAAASSKEILKQCENMVFSLKNTDEYNMFSEELNDLLEEIKYSDVTSEKYTKEFEIVEKIQKLSEDLEYYSNSIIDEKKVKESIKAIVKLVKERNFQIRQH